MFYVINKKTVDGARNGGHRRAKSALANPPPLDLDRMAGRKLQAGFNGQEVT
jgi:hypothetical protein